MRAGVRRFVVASAAALASPFLAHAISQTGAPGDLSRLAGHHFSLRRDAEVLATLTASCAGCSWATRGREAAVLEVLVDGRYSQHVILFRGEAVHPYRILLGTLRAGDHELDVRVDRTLTPPAIRRVTVSRIHIRALADGDPDHQAVALAPILHARADTIGAFGDVPLLTWFEMRRTPADTTEIRYSVVFSNEDGGTPTDRLMATWGRATDIEFVYGVELAANGAIIGDRFQASGHEIRPFRGRRDGRHPFLWVVTDNNMVSDTGTSTMRFAVAPLRFDLETVSREAVMDAHPWTYQVMAQELLREGRIAADARPGTGRIPDPRRFVYVEGCGELQDATLSCAVATSRAAGAATELEWHESDGGLPPFRIARDGCFRLAVALPAGVAADAVRALRFNAFTRLPREGEAPLPPGTGKARLDRVNRVFLLNADYTPGPDLFVWRGPAELVAEGPPIVFGVRQ